MRKMDQYKVSNTPICDLARKQLEDSKKRLEQLLAKPLKSEKEVYDNIVQLKRFLSYPHDHIPDAENRINEKLYFIQQELGKDVLDKGIKMYELHEARQAMYTAISVNERVRIENEIVQHSALAEKLDEIRYNPEKYKNLTGKYAIYLIVYCNMVEREMDEREEEKKDKEENQIA